MDLRRFWRHVLMSPARARDAFARATLDAIQREIAACEKSHRGQLVFVVEAELTSGQLWRELGSRERARQVFALHGVWNTEENNGVLIYVLLADRRVEIVADRGIHSRVGATAWEVICGAMQREFGQGRFEPGVIGGIQAISDLLGAHFPARGAENPNELSDKPVVL